MHHKRMLDKIRRNIRRSETMNKSQPEEPTSNITEGKIVTNKIDKVKIHLQDNKKVYIGFTAGVVTTIAALGGFVLANRINPAKVVQTISGLGNNIAIKPKNCTLIQQTFTTRKGRPGIMVMCDQTKKLYESLTQAGSDMDLSVSSISQQLNGKKDAVKGFTFSHIDVVE